MKIKNIALILCLILGLCVAGCTQTQTQNEKPTVKPQPDDGGYTINSSSELFTLLAPQPELEGHVKTIVINHHINNSGVDYFDFTIKLDQPVPLPNLDVETSDTYHVAGNLSIQTSTWYDYTLKPEAQ